MNNLISTCMAIILIAIFTSCSKDNPTTPPVAADPEGTITTSINYTLNQWPVILFSGLAADGPYAYNGSSYPYVQINIGMNGSLIFVSLTTLSTDAYLTSPTIGLGYSGTEVANVGKVSGLGDVTTKPTSGWSANAAVQVGHGYVVRFKKSKDYATANLPYVYARFYVVDWMTSSTTGGVIGGTMKYQTPF